MGTHEELPFLEPPHSHDVTNISHLASIPTCMLDQLPAEVQDALWALQESTSVVYASYSRFQDIVSTRLDRLTTLPDDPASFNEGAFFTYQGQLTNERSYLLDDCLPDWKHKLMHLDLEQYSSLTITHLGQRMTIKNWLDRLQSTVLYWADEARSAQIPDFEETVSEYQSQSTTPTSDDGRGRALSVEEGANPVAVDRKSVLLGPSKHKTGIGREIEQAMGIKRADS